MENIVPTLIRSFALCLDLPVDYFEEFFKSPTLIQRIIYYRPGDSFAGKHTDNGFFTILIQEHLPSPSLQVYTKGKWIDAHCLENIFVVNLGDILQHWTNKRFISTPHRVKHKLATDRISLPFFIYPVIEAKFTPLNSTKVYSVQDIMLKNFDSIWIEKTGAGRAREL